MSERPIISNGFQYLRRKQGDKETSHQHSTEMRIDADGASYRVTSPISGEHGTTGYTDPAKADVIRDMDRAHLSASIADLPPATEPTRVPVVSRDHPGMRQCPKCGGARMIVDEVGAEVICPRCDGTGRVPNGIGLDPLYE